MTVSCDSLVKLLPRQQLTCCEAVLKPYLEQVMKLLVQSPTEDLIEPKKTA